MAINDYLPREDAELQVWLSNYYNVCEINETVLDLDAEEFLALNVAISDYSASLTAQATALAAAKSATANKNAKKSAVSSLVRAYTREFKANPAVPNTVLNALGVVVSTTVTPPVLVTNLTVSGCDDGVNTVKWDRSTNSPGTIFIVEYRKPSETDWRFAAAITKTSFAHDEQIPGVTLLYRVIASRAGESSPPSPPTIVYGNLSDPGLSIAA
jgi:hypothetical protein